MLACIERNKLLKIKESLTKPVSMGGRTLPNRFLIQPLESSDADERGLFTNSTYERYGDFVKGGAAVVVIESFSITKESRSCDTQLLLDIDDYYNKRAWIQFITRMKRINPDTVIIAQPNHGGSVLSPVTSNPVYVTPPIKNGVISNNVRLIDKEYIDEYMKRYADSAKFLADIGFDGIDLKYCNGYLHSQILSPFNNRDWKYGGTPEKRRQFAFDLCDMVRERVKNKKFLIGAKVGVFDELPGGQGHANDRGSTALELTEIQKLCRGLEERGCSFFIESIGSVASGWSFLSPTPDCAENVNLHLLATSLIKRCVRQDTVVIASGLSMLSYNGDKCGTSLCEKGIFETASLCISEGKFDMIGMGRQAYADSFVPAKIMNIDTDKFEEPNMCLCCNICARLFEERKQVGCVVYNNKYCINT